ncbi:MAG: hypothetical protein V3T86_17015 [Planctomycetota bacterium]
MKFAQRLLGVAIGAAAASAVFLASSDSKATERISKEPVFTEADLESARIEGLATASTKIKEQESEIARLEAQSETLEKQIADASLPLDGGAADDERKPRFLYKGLERPLSVVDWKQMGESFVNLQPILVELSQTLKSGKQLTPELMQRIQKWNTPLVRHALNLQSEGVPGDQVNSAFTHPSVYVNVVYSTLREAKRPLFVEQEETLGELGYRFTAEDGARVAAYSDGTLSLQKLLEESALKDRFFQAIDDLLTPEQQAVLHSPETRGRASFDLFSSGLLWQLSLAPILQDGREDYLEKVFGHESAQLELDEAGVALLRSVLSDWVARLPDEFLAKPKDPLAKMGAMKMDHGLDAARRVLEMRREVLNRLALTDAQRKTLVERVGVWVPFAK